MSPDSNLPVLSANSNAFLHLSNVVILTSIDAIKCDRISEHSPLDITNLFALSGYVYLPNPSAIFPVILVDARRNWEVSP